MFQRTFVSELRRCSDLERQLRYLRKEIVNENIPFVEEMEPVEVPHPRDINRLEVSIISH